MNYQNTENSELLIERADDANVPVNVSITEPNEANPKWILSACNYMPRKGRVAECAYQVEADTREDLEMVIDTFIVPLYEAALNNLKNKRELYYWS